MPLSQELFDKKTEAIAAFQATQHEIADHVLARMLATQLLDESMVVGEGFEFNPSELDGAQKVLCALMRGEVTVDIQDERDVLPAALKEVNVADLLRRIHGATIEVIGVTMPGVGAVVDG